jgi:hypothetical protein
MMKRVVLALVAIYLMTANVSTLGAQPCVRFSPTAPCANAKAARPPLFGPPQPSLPKPSPQPPVAQTEIVMEQAVDCKMVRPIDPAFYSAMPILRAQPDVMLALKIIVPPPCRP